MRKKKKFPLKKNLDKASRELYEALEMMVWVYADNNGTASDLRDAVSMARSALRLARKTGRKE